MKKALLGSALFLIAGTAASFNQHVFEVNGIGVTWNEARNDARAQARVTCDAMGGVLMLEEIQTYQSGSHYIFHGLAHCNLP